MSLKILLDGKFPAYSKIRTKLSIKRKEHVKNRRIDHQVNDQLLYVTKEIDVLRENWITVVYGWNVTGHLPCLLYFLFVNHDLIMLFTQKVSF